MASTSESFEKEYYEADHFWEGQAIQDENNIKRFRLTESMVPATAKSLADIGCGNGIFLSLMQERRPSVELLGVDRSEKALSFVKCNKVIGDVSSIPVPDKSYDCITCLEVIEHLPVTVFENALQELTRVSKEYVLISVPFSEILEENYTKCPRCKTSFNADLHLRSFSKEDMTGLLTKYGFKAERIEMAGERINFKGHYKFRKMFYPEQFQQWRSPICPICGYKETMSTPGDHSGGGETVTNNKPSRSILSYFTSLPKQLWPKEKKYFWILGLYKRESLTSK